jgi:hypothetical protein
MALDVQRGHVQEARIVLELAQPAIAVEAEQGPDATRLVTVVDVRGGGHPADGAEPTLGHEHRIGVIRGYPVSAPEMVGPLSSHRFSGATGPRVVTGFAIGVHAVTAAGISAEGGQHLDLATVGTPLVSTRNDQSTWKPMLGPSGASGSALVVALPRVSATIKSIAISRVAVPGELAYRPFTITVSAELLLHGAACQR